MNRSRVSKCLVALPITQNKSDEDLFGTRRSDCTRSLWGVACLLSGEFVSDGAISALGFLDFSLCMVFVYLAWPYGREWNKGGMSERARH